MANCGMVMIWDLEFRGWGFRVGLGLRIRSSGFRVQGSGLRVLDSGLMVGGWAFRVEGFRFRFGVQASGFKV